MKGTLKRKFSFRAGKSSDKDDQGYSASAEMDSVGSTSSQSEVIGEELTEGTMGGTGVGGSSQSSPIVEDVFTSGENSPAGHHWNISGSYIPIPDNRAETATSQGLVKQLSVADTSPSVKADPSLSSTARRSSSRDNVASPRSSSEFKVLPHGGKIRGSCGSIDDREDSKPAGVLLRKTSESDGRDWMTKFKGDNMVSKLSGVQLSAGHHPMLDAPNNHFDIQKRACQILQD